MNPTAATIEALKVALSNPSAEPEMVKSFVQSGSATSGLTYYDLEAPAKTLYLVLTPLRNRIARVSGKGGIQANWVAITGINSAKQRAGLLQGARGTIISTTVQDYFAAYRGIGFDDNVTFEAEYAGMNFQDIRATAQLGLLRSLMIAEENILLGGNTSLALGTTPTPTVSASGSGSSLPAALVSVRCVALTPDGYSASSVAGGVSLSGNVTTADGSTKFQNSGTAIVSAAGTVTPTAGQNVLATVTPVTGAVAYAWFWGASGAETLGAITTINSVSISAAATGTQVVGTNFNADYSKDGYVFDGLLTQIFNPTFNSYVVQQPTGTAGVGTPLTASNAGGIVEIDGVLKYLWDNYRLSPNAIYVSSQEQKNISAKILSTNSQTAARFMLDAKQGAIAGGTMVRSYLNPFTMNGAAEIPILLHPYMPPGTIMFYTDELPYQLSNVANVVQVRTRQDYYSMEWPLKTRMYEYGVYADEVLQNYFPPAFAVITNIANG